MKLQTNLYSSLLGAIVFALTASGSWAIVINNAVNTETGLGGDIYCASAFIDVNTRNIVPVADQIDIISPLKSKEYFPKSSQTGLLCSWSKDFFKLHQLEGASLQDLAQEGAIWLKFSDLQNNPQFLDVREWKDFGQNKKYEYERLVATWKNEHKSPTTQVINRGINQLVATTIELENIYEHPIWLMALYCKRDVTALHQPRTCERLAMTGSYEDRSVAESKLEESEGNQKETYIKINPGKKVKVIIKHDSRVIEYMKDKPSEYKDYLTENPYQLVLVASPFLEDLEYRPTHTLSPARQFLSGSRFGRVASYDYYAPANLIMRANTPDMLCLIPSFNKHQGIGLFHKEALRRTARFSSICREPKGTWTDTGIGLASSMLTDETKTLGIPPLLSAMGLSDSFVKKYKNHVDTTISSQKGFDEVAKVKSVDSISRISQEEKNAIAIRKTKIAKSNMIAQLVQANLDITKIPNIALAASGGGYRAMIATLGFKEALADSGIDELLTYQVGLSGSTWYLSKFLELAHENKLPDENLYKKLRADLRLKPQFNGGKYLKSYNFLAWPDPLTDHDIFMQFYLPLIKKWAYLQDISTVDLMGSGLWYNLFPKEDPNSLTLSKFQNLVSSGEVPYTLMSAITKPTGEDYLWFEFSPFNTGLTESKHHIETKHLGRYFINGKSFSGAPELTLPYLMGIWGSAMSGRVIDGIKQGMIGEETNLPPIISSLNEGIKDALNAGGVASQLAPSLMILARLQPMGGLDDTNKKKTLDLIQYAIDELARAKSSAHIWLKEIVGGEQNLEEAQKRLATLSQKISENKPITMDDIWQAYLPLQPLFKKLKSVGPDRVNLFSDRLGKAKSAQELQFFTGAVLGNPYFGLDYNNDEAVADKIRNAPTVELRDGGTAFNIPFPLLMKDERDVDIIIAFDSLGSEDELGNALKRACEYARDYSHKRFPYEKCLEDFNNQTFLEAMKAEPFTVINDTKDKNGQIIIYIPLKPLKSLFLQQIETQKVLNKLPWFKSLRIEKQKEILYYNPQENFYTGTMNMVYTADQVDDLANFARLLGDLAAPEIKKLFVEKWKEKSP